MTNPNPTQGNARVPQTPVTTPYAALNERQLTASPLQMYPAQEYRPSGPSTPSGAAGTVAGQNHQRHVCRVGTSPLRRPIQAPVFTPQGTPQQLHSNPSENQRRGLFSALDYDSMPPLVEASAYSNRHPNTAAAVDLLRLKDAYMPSHDRRSPSDVASTPLCNSTAVTMSFVPTRSPNHKSSPHSLQTNATATLPHIPAFHFGFANTNHYGSSSGRGGVDSLSPIYGHSGPGTGTTSSPTTHIHSPTPEQVDVTGSNFGSRSLLSIGLAHDGGEQPHPLLRQGGHRLSGISDAFMPTTTIHVNSAPLSGSKTPSPILPGEQSLLTSEFPIYHDVGHSTHPHLSSSASTNMERDGIHPLTRSSTIAGQGAPLSSTDDLGGSNFSNAFSNRGQFHPPSLAPHPFHRRPRATTAALPTTLAIGTVMDDPRNSHTSVISPLNVQHPYGQMDFANGAMMSSTAELAGLTATGAHAVGGNARHHQAGGPTGGGSNGDSADNLAASGSTSIGPPPPNKPFALINNNSAVRSAAATAVPSAAQGQVSRMRPASSGSSSLTPDDNAASAPFASTSSGRALHYSVGTAYHGHLGGGVFEYSSASHPQPNNCYESALPTCVQTPVDNGPQEFALSVGGGRSLPPSGGNHMYPATMANSSGTSSAVNRSHQVHLSNSSTGGGRMMPPSPSKKANFSMRPPSALTHSHSTLNTGRGAGTSPSRRVYDGSRNGNSIHTSRSGSPQILSLRSGEVGGVVSRTISNSQQLRHASPSATVSAANRNPFSPYRGLSSTNISVSMSHLVPSAANSTLVSPRQTLSARGVNNSIANISSHFEAGQQPSHFEGRSGSQLHINSQSGLHPSLLPTDLHHTRSQSIGSSTLHLGSPAAASADLSRLGNNASNSNLLFYGTQHAPRSGSVASAMANAHYNNTNNGTSHPQILVPNQLLSPYTTASSSFVNMSGCAIDGGGGHQQGNPSGSTSALATTAHSAVITFEQLVPLATSTTNHNASINSASATSVRNSHNSRTQHQHGGSPPQRHARHPNVPVAGPGVRSSTGQLGRQPTLQTGTLNTSLGYSPASVNHQFNSSNGNYYDPNATSPKSQYSDGAGCAHALFPIAGSSDTASTANQSSKGRHHGNVSHTSHVLSANSQGSSPRNATRPANVPLQFPSAAHASGSRYSAPQRYSTNQLAHYSQGASVFDSNSPAALSPQKQQHQPPDQELHNYNTGAFATSRALHLGLDDDEALPEGHPLQHAERTPQLPFIDRSLVRDAAQRRESSTNEVGFSSLDAGGVVVSIPALSASATGEDDSSSLPPQPSASGSRNQLRSLATYMAAPIALTNTSPDDYLDTPSSNTNQTSTSHATPADKGVVAAVNIGNSFGDVGFHPQYSRQLTSGSGFAMSSQSTQIYGANSPHHPNLSTAGMVTKTYSQVQPHTVAPPAPLNSHQLRLNHQQLELMTSPNLASATVGPTTPQQQLNSTTNGGGTDLTSNSNGGYQENSSMGSPTFLAHTRNTAAGMSSIGHLTQQFLEASGTVVFSSGDFSIGPSSPAGSPLGHLSSTANRLRTQDMAGGGSPPYLENTPLATGPRTTPAHRQHLHTGIAVHFPSGSQLDSHSTMIPNEGHSPSKHVHGPDFGLGFDGGSFGSAPNCAVQDTAGDSPFTEFESDMSSPDKARTIPRRGQFVVGGLSMSSGKDDMSTGKQLRALTRRHTVPFQRLGKEDDDEDDEANDTTLCNDDESATHNNTRNNMNLAHLSMNSDAADSRPVSGNDRPLVLRQETELPPPTVSSVAKPAALAVKAIALTNCAKALDMDSEDDTRDFRIPSVDATAPSPAPSMPATPSRIYDRASQPRYRSLTMEEPARNQCFVNDTSGGDATPMLPQHTSIAVYTPTGGSSNTNNIPCLMFPSMGTSYTNGQGQLMQPLRSTSHHTPLDHYKKRRSGSSIALGAAGGTGSGCFFNDGTSVFAVSTNDERTGSKAVTCTDDFPGGSGDNIADEYTPQCSPPVSPPRHFTGGYDGGDGGNNFHHPEDTNSNYYQSPQQPPRRPQSPSAVIHHNDVHHNRYSSTICEEQCFSEEGSPEDIEQDSCNSSSCSFCVGEREEATARIATGEILFADYVDNNGIESRDETPVNEKDDNLKQTAFIYRHRLKFRYLIPWLERCGYLPYHADVNGTIWVSTSLIEGMPYCAKEVFIDESAVLTGDDSAVSDPQQRANFDFVDFSRESGTPIHVGTGNASMGLGATPVRQQGTRQSALYGQDSTPTGSLQQLASPQRAGIAYAYPSPIKKGISSDQPHFREGGSGLVRDDSNGAYFSYTGTPNHGFSTDNLCVIPNAASAVGGTNQLLKTPVMSSPPYSGSGGGRTPNRPATATALLLGKQMHELNGGMSTPIGGGGGTGSMYLSSGNKNQSSNMLGTAPTATNTTFFSLAARKALRDELSILTLAQKYPETAIGISAAQYLIRLFAVFKSHKSGAYIIQTEYLPAGCLHERWLAYREGNTAPQESTSAPRRAASSSMPAPHYQSSTIDFSSKLLNTTDGSLFTNDSSNCANAKVTSGLPGSASSLTVDQLLATISTSPFAVKRNRSASPMSPQQKQLISGLVGETSDAVTDPSMMGNSPMVAQPTDLISSIMCQSTLTVGSGGTGGGNSPDVPEPMVYDGQQQQQAYEQQQQLDYSATLPEEESVLSCVYCVLQALTAIHSSGYVHGNPISLSVFPTANPSLFKLGNFGAAKRIQDQSALLDENTFVPMAYLAPKGTKARDDLKSRDIYAFGASLVHLLLRCLLKTEQSALRASEAAYADQSEGGAAHYDDNNYDDGDVTLHPVTRQPIQIQSALEELYTKASSYFSPSLFRLLAMLTSYEGCDSETIAKATTIIHENLFAAASDESPIAPGAYRDDSSRSHMHQQSVPATKFDVLNSFQAQEELRKAASVEASNLSVKLEALKDQLNRCISQKKPRRDDSEVMRTASVSEGGSTPPNLATVSNNTSLMILSPATNYGGLVAGQCSFSPSTTPAATGISLPHPTPTTSQQLHNMGRGVPRSPPLMKAARYEGFSTLVPFALGGGIAAATTPISATLNQQVSPASTSLMMYGAQNRSIGSEDNGGGGHGGAGPLYTSDAHQTPISNQHYNHNGVSPNTPALMRSSSSCGSALLHVTGPSPFGPQPTHSAHLSASGQPMPLPLGRSSFSVPVGCSPSLGGSAPRTFTQDGGAPPSGGLTRHCSSSQTLGATTNSTIVGGLLSTNSIPNTMSFNGDERMHMAGETIQLVISLTNSPALEPSANPMHSISRIPSMSLGATTGHPQHHQQQPPHSAPHGFSLNLRSPTSLGQKRAKEMNRFPPTSAANSDARALSPRQSSYNNSSQLTNSTTAAANVPHHHHHHRHQHQSHHSSTSSHGHPLGSGELTHHHHVDQHHLPPLGPHPAASPATHGHSHRSAQQDHSSVNVSFGNGEQQVSLHGSQSRNNTSQTRLVRSNSGLQTTLAATVSEGALITAAKVVQQMVDSGVIHPFPHGRELTQLFSSSPHFRTKGASSLPQPGPAAASNDSRIDQRPNPKVPEEDDNLADITDIASAASPMNSCASPTSPIEGSGGREGQRSMTGNSMFPGTMMRNRQQTDDTSPDGQLFSVAAEALRQAVEEDETDNANALNVADPKHHSVHWSGLQQRQELSVSGAELGFKLSRKPQQRPKKDKQRRAASCPTAYADDQPTSSLRPPSGGEMEHAATFSLPIGSAHSSVAVDLFGSPEKCRATVMSLHMMRSPPHVLPSPAIAHIAAPFSNHSPQRSLFMDAEEEGDEDLQPQVVQRSATMSLERRMDGLHMGSRRPVSGPYQPPGASPRRL